MESWIAFYPHNEVHCSMQVLSRAKSYIQHFSLLTQTVYSWLQFCLSKELIHQFLVMQIGFPLSTRLTEVMDISGEIHSWVLAEMD